MCDFDYPECRPVPTKTVDGRVYFQRAADVAGCFRVSDRQLRRWVEDGCPGRGEHGWDFASVFTWRMGKDAIDRLGKPQRRRKGGR